MRRPTILWIALVSAIVTLLAIVTALGVAPASAQDAPFAKPTPTATPTSAPPPAPTVLNPLQGGVTTGTNEPPLGMPTFAWSLPVIAPYYHIQVSNSPGFTVLKVDQDTRGMSYTPTDVWDDGTYYWRVKAGIGTGSNPVWGPYTAIQTFVKDWGDEGTIRPSLINPAADAVRSGFIHGDFQWSPVPGAAGYVFEIATDPLMNNRVYIAESIKAQHTPTVRLTNSNYYWRITPFAYSSSATTRVSGESSEVRRFTIDWSTAPQLLAPDNGLQARFTPRFQWTAVEAAESYVLEVSTDVNFNPANLAEKKVFETHNTDFTPTDALANDKEWFWHVKAIDGAEGNTNWSEVRSFRMAWGAIELLTPANNQIQLAYPFFSWKSVPGARSYQLQIDNSVDFAAPFIADVEIFNVTNYAQPDWRIVQVSDYYWQVRAKDENGNFGPWSERRAFRISTPLDSVVPSNLIYPPPYYAIDAAETPVQRQMAPPAQSSSGILRWTRTTL
ncbi:MAG: hypothetical protein IPK16_09155 [Anaerolineales bacterium]|nr:hypothetical protein [Anaerolineales bacterium]